MKAPGRVRVGEQPSRGEVRPVTNRTLIITGLLVVFAVVAATTAIILASAGTKARVTSGNNTPHSLQSGSPSRTGSYQETAQLPAVLRTAPATGDPAKTETVSASLTLNCTSGCASGSYSGFGGRYPLIVKGSRLTGSSHSACEDDALVLNAATVSTAGPLPKTFTGTLTRTSTCPGTEVASPVSISLQLR